MLQLTVVSTAPINLPYAIAINCQAPSPLPLLLLEPRLKDVRRRHARKEHGTAKLNRERRFPLREPVREFEFHDGIIASAVALFRRRFESMCAIEAKLLGRLGLGLRKWSFKQSIYQSIYQSIDRSIFSKSEIAHARLMMVPTRALTIRNPSLNRCKVYPFTQHAGRRLSPSR